MLRTPFCAPVTHRFFGLVLGFVEHEVGLVVVVVEGESFDVRGYVVIILSKSSDDNRQQNINQVKKKNIKHSLVQTFRLMSNKIIYYIVSEELTLHCIKLIV